MSDLLYSLIAEDFGIKGNGNWYRSEEHSSLVLDRKKDIFYFNALGINGNALTYLLKVRHYNLETAKAYLAKAAGQISFITSPKKEVIIYPELVEVFYRQGKTRECREYFYKRGLTDETIDRNLLGWYNDFNTVPVFENGEFKNFQLRRDNPKLICSYYRNLEAYLYNSDILKIVSRVFFVEGPGDVLILQQNGIPAVCVTGGNTFLPKWYSKFIHQKEIILLFDNDSAGNNESIRMAKFLGEGRCKLYNFWGFAKKYDPVNFFQDKHSVSELLSLIEKNSKYVFEMNMENVNRV